MTLGTQALENETESIMPTEEKLFFNDQLRSTFNLSDLKNLFVNPVEFFRSGVALNNTYIIIAAYLAGICAAIERVDKTMYRHLASNAQDVFMTGIQESWIWYWLFIGFIGAIGGFFVLNIGGWWYNVRIKWCSIKDFDRAEGRSVYIFNRMIIVIPSIIYTLVQTIVYRNYYDAFQASTILGNITVVALIGFLIWSIINSYRSVVEIFKPNKTLAAVWFLVLPLVMALLALFFIIIALLV